MKNTSPILFNYSTQLEIVRPQIPETFVTACLVCSPLPRPLHRSSQTTENLLGLSITKQHRPILPAGSKLPNYLDFTAERCRSLHGFQTSRNKHELAPHTFPIISGSVKRLSPDPSGTQQ